MPVEISDRGLTCLILYNRPSQEMGKLVGKDPIPLLCAGTRFLVEHQLHWLGDEGFRQIRLALNDRSKPTEEVVGDGMRWGAQVSYAYDAQHLTLMGRLRKHMNLAKDGLLLMEGNTMMRFTMPRSLSRTTLFDAVQKLPILYLSASDWLQVVEKCDANDVSSLCEWVRKNLSPEQVKVDAYFHRLDSMAGFIQMNQEMLRSPEKFHFRGEEMGSGVRVGRRTHISSRATFKGPVVVGDETFIKHSCSIGPNVFIGHNSVIEKGAHLSNSVIGPNTYIGRDTSFTGKYVCRNFVVDLQQGTHLFIDDPVILADLTRSAGMMDRMEQLWAFMMLLGTLPLLLLLLPIHRILRGEWVTAEHVLIQPVARNLKSGYDFTWMNWYRFRFGMFLVDFLPGLVNVLSGKLKFVGNPPLTEKDVTHLEGLFIGDMLRGKAGLTGLVQQQSGELTQDDVLATALFYNATRTVSGDFRLFFRAMVPGVHQFKRDIVYEPHHS